MLRGGSVATACLAAAVLLAIHSQPRPAAAQASQADLVNALADKVAADANATASQFLLDLLANRLCKEDIGPLFPNTCLFFNNFSQTLLTSYPQIRVALGRDLKYLPFSIMNRRRMLLPQDLALKTPEELCATVASSDPESNLEYDKGQNEAVRSSELDAERLKVLAARYLTIPSSSDYKDKFFDGLKDALLLREAVALAKKYCALLTRNGDDVGTARAERKPGGLTDVELAARIRELRVQLRTDVMNLAAIYFRNEAAVLDRLDRLRAEDRVGFLLGFTRDNLIGVLIPPARGYELRQIDEPREIRRVMSTTFPLIVAMADADNAAEARKAMDAFTSPTTAWRLKRIGSMIELGAILGAMTGAERLRSETVPTDGHYSSRVRGVFAPVGIGATMPVNVIPGLPGSPLGVFMSLLDLGQVVETRSNSTDGTGNDVTDVQRKSSVGLQDVYSPGLYVTLGLGNSPFVIGAGLSRTPGLREVTLANGDAATMDADRKLVFIGVDLVWFPLF